MIKRLLNTQTSTITSAALILGAASFVSRLIGIVRDRVFAHTFGAGDVLDAYFAAFRIPDLVYNLVIVGALSAGFIPIFTNLLAKDKNEAWQVTNGVINILGLFLLTVCGVLFVLTPTLIPYLVPGFSSEKIEITTTLTRIMFLSPILLGLSGIVSGVMQSFKAFLIYSLTPIIYNIGIIIGVIFFVPIFGINGLGYGVILGSLLHLTIQIPSLLHYGFKYNFKFYFRNKHLKKIGLMMIPRTLGLATTQLNLIVITVLASTVGTGSVSVFNFANNIQHFPIGIVGISFAIAAFPTLAGLMAEDKKDQMIEHLSHTLRQVIFLIVPLTVIFLLLRAQIVRVILGSGQFNWNDTINTANTLAFFVLSLFAQALIPTLVRGFFVLQDTWTPFLAGLVSSLVNIIGGVYLKNIFGVSGLALAFSIAMIVNLILLWLPLRHKLGSLHESKMINSLFKISSATLVMALTIQMIKQPLANLVDMARFWGILTQGALAGTVGVLIYMFICHYLQVDEFINLKQSFKKKILKVRPVQAELTQTDEV